MLNELKQQIMRSIAVQYSDLKYIKEYLYFNPETGGEEEKSSAVLISYLKHNGFEVSEDFCDIPWCFRAVYDSGRPGLAIGLTAEYDALPVIGHACGHNIIAASSTGAAVALKAAVDTYGGKVILYGTPAEENLDRKIDMAEKGVFSEIDICLNMHPYGVNMMPRTSTAFDSWRVDFYGRTAHAAIHPEDGINALDTAVAFYQMVNQEKQSVEGLNLYGIIPEGGVKYSIIPDHTVVKFAARAYHNAPIRVAEAIIKNAAEAACALNGSTYEIRRDEASNLPLNTNMALADAFIDIFENLTGEPMPVGEFGASLDLGNVSWKVPVIMPCIGIGCPGTDLHTPEFCKATMTNDADRALRHAAEALALTGLKVIEDQGLLRAVRKEFVHGIMNK